MNREVLHPETMIPDKIHEKYSKINHNRVEFWENATYDGYFLKIYHEYIDTNLGDWFLGHQNRKLKIENICCF